MSDPLPPHLEHLTRYSMPAAERTLSEMLDLAWHPQMQDWDLINANPDLLPRLVGLLLNQDLSDDEHFSAMSLAIASYDDVLREESENVAVWSQLKEQLTDRSELFASIIWYWAQPMLHDEEPFPISGAMAEIWRQVLERLPAGGRGGA